MWPFPKRAKLPLAEIDHLVFGAVADAIEPAPESFEPVGVIIPNSDPEIPVDNEVGVYGGWRNSAGEPIQGQLVYDPRKSGAMTIHLSPEYHAGLAARMIESLDADDARLTEAIATEISQHETLIAALHAELAGVRKVREAYAKVGETLAEPATEASPSIKSQRISRSKRTSAKPPVIVDHAATE